MRHTLKYPMNINNVFKFLRKLSKIYSLVFLFSLFLDTFKLYLYKAWISKLERINVI